MSTAQPMELKGEGGVVAPVYMGAYTRAAVDHYIGSYLTIRPAFAKPDTIVAYRTDIVWDPEWPSLLFEERDRPDAPFSHRGRLYIPASSMFIHLVSLTKGAMRMVLVSQIDQDGEMRGLITTLNKQRAMFVPVSVADRLHQAPGVQRRERWASITPKSADYAAYKALLEATHRRGLRAPRRHLIADGRRSALLLETREPRPRSGLPDLGRTSSGVPVCSVAPLWSTLTRSASASASVMSCVTRMIGISSDAPQRGQLPLQVLARHAIDGRERLVEKEHARARAPARGRARPAGARHPRARPGRRSANALRDWTRASSCARDLRAAPPSAVGPSAMATLSSAVRCGKSA